MTPSTRYARGSRIGIRVPVLTDEDDEYRQLLTAFGYWNLPLHFLERPSTSASRRGKTRGNWTALVTLLARRDHETNPDARLSVDDEMRAAVKAHVPAV